MQQIHRNSPIAAWYVPDFSEPLGLLVHCHVKIERQLESLERAVRLLETDDAAAVPSIMEAIVAAQRHFAGPGVKHTADEEESLFPRLRRFANGSDAGVLAALNELEAQHRSLDLAHARFDELIEAGGPLPVPGTLDLAELERTVGEMLGVYRPHILMENEIIFPEAARILPPEEIAAVGAEMRARRGLPAIGD